MSAALATRARRVLRAPQAMRLKRRLGSPGPPMPLIVGMTRSGTTLLRMMLDSHPELAIPPETHFAPGVVRRFRKSRRSAEWVTALIAAERRWPDFGLEEEGLRRRLELLEPLDAGRALRAFYSLYAEGQGKSRFGDKTPGYVVRMGAIQSALPEARFIHMIRDGRDVALSYQRKDPDPDGVKRIAIRWAQRIQRARELAERLDGYIEVRFEALVEDPRTELERVAELIELDWSDSMLSYHERAEQRLKEIERELPGDEERPAMAASERIAMHSLVARPPQSDRVGVFKREMPEEQIMKFELVAGDMLDELGYQRAT